ncbi:Protein of uncharacterised function (DUF1415) [Legionella busanensis]|uniref:Protein of uncharacterized function (DUF1415) n=1 Tax=Legionella busanensis TaxID=190655 RepID=A0A378JSA1_9GAMM|nr:DUF1415 domain-containing protein [Legionella busanensis]STX52690.1 Protein of uncharacterised function (DUF1415) [Legionella busanensis]
MIQADLIIQQTKNWITSFIIPLKLCPFAKYVIDQNTIRFSISQAPNKQLALADLRNEIINLESNKTIETTIVIFPELFKDFLTYLDFTAFAEKKLIKKQYEGIYQFATFHPDYCFADAESQDVTNYTNRSPYPLVHILREESIEQAIAFYGNTEEIPLNNIALLRKLGLEKVITIISKTNTMTCTNNIENSS